MLQLSEISIPHYLTASIFSAESSKTALFHQNVRLLVMLCIMAGVCRLLSKLQCPLLVICNIGLLALNLSCTTLHIWLYELMICSIFWTYSGIRGCMFGIANMILVSTLTIVFFNLHVDIWIHWNLARAQRGCHMFCKEKIKYYKQDAVVIFFSWRNLSK